MRRGILLLLIGLFVFVTLAPWWVGRGIEDRHREVMGDSSMVEALSYERGFFSSQAQDVVELVPFESDAEGGSGWGVRLVLHHRIEHGPYPTAWIRSEAFDGSALGAFVKTTASVEIEDAETIEELALPIVMRTQVRGEDALRFRLAPDAQATAFEDPDLDVDWAGTFIEIDVQGDRLEGRMELPRVHYKIAQDEEAFDETLAMTFALEGFRYRFGYDAVGENVAQPLYVGGSDLAVDRLAVVGGDGGFELAKLTMKDASDAEGEVWSHRAEIALASIGATAEPHGPLEFDYAIANVGIEPLAELGTAFESLSTGDVEGEAMQAEMMGAFTTLWPRLMATGPSFEVPRFRLATPDGEIRFTLRVAVDSDQAAAIAHPFMTLPALEVDAEIAVPETLVRGGLAASASRTPGEDDPAWLGAVAGASLGFEEWLAQGLIEQHDDRYVTSLRMRQGALRVNGRVLSTGGSSSTPGF